MPAEDFWPEFGEGSAPDVVCEGEGSLAVRVLETFGIPYASSLGGDLPDLDIKHMDAIQVLKLSLLEESANSGEIYEPIMNSAGEVEFKTIGDGGNVSDIYYEIQTSTYKEDCSGVMVIGKDPMAFRKSTEWYPIWGDNRPEPLSAGWLYSSCNKPSFNQYCTLVYNDPHLDSSYKDGIANLYEINESNPWDTITGYATYTDWPGWESDQDTVVTRTDTARVLLPLGEEPSLGVLRKRPSADRRWGEDPACFDETDAVSADGGVEVEIPEDWRYDSVRGTVVDKFAGIIGVYVLGWQIATMRGKPVNLESAVNAAPITNDAKFILSIKHTSPLVYKLVEGQHYVVAFEGNDPAVPYIVFADNMRPGEAVVIDGIGGNDYVIDPHCEYASSDNSDASVGHGLILPTGPMKGLKIDQVFVGVELETPSILVYNPNGNSGRAEEVAKDLTYDLRPIVTTDEPAPIAFNGSIINQVDSIIDHDPTTQQNLEDTELEQALEQMDAGGGMSLTLSFLDEGQCATLSSALYDHMNSGSGVEATYICGPNCNPDLGGTGPNGGIINSITYSYQDSNSYTISVNCGPRLVGGMSQVTGGPSPKAAESFSAKGTVVQDEGNHIYFKVRVDGFKEVTAVNMCPAVVRVGDKVNVSIHNNPVEE
jgi:hypothetical protein